jgi:hypothetical protein
MSDFPEHASLLELEKNVLSEIKNYGECIGELARQPQRLEASIQTKLSQIRALTRDLELLVEELDRYGVVINRHFRNILSDHMYMTCGTSYF